MPLFLQHTGNTPLWLALLVLFAALMFLGIGKAGFGGGVGLVTPPLLAMIMPVKLLLPLMLPLLIACDVASLWTWRGKWDLRNFWRLLPGTVIGVAAGTGLLGTLPERELKAGLGALAVAFVTIQLVRQRNGTSGAHYSPKAWHGFVAGFLGGFCSVLAHAAGPVITLFLLPQRLGKERFVATTVLYYSVLNWIKVPSYVLTGMLTVKVLGAAVWLVPLILLGVYTGVKLNRAIPEGLFNNVVYAIVIVTGVKLLLG
jgi:uncharacterized membrane protein YfcA